MNCKENSSKQSAKRGRARFIHNIRDSDTGMSFVNRIFCGDCLEILQNIPSNSIDLVYLDPPFFSNRSFEVISYDDCEVRRFEDRWKNGIEQYIDWMRERIRECRRVLKKTGSFYLHCDWHASHYLKVELDKIFGWNKLRNEIIWKRHNAHNDIKQGAKSLGRLHDTILFYTKSNRYTWNMIYKPYDEDYIKRFYKHVESRTGRRYALGDLTGPGGAAKGNPYYTFKGIKRYWRYSQKKMKQLDKRGRIFQRKKGSVPLLKRYLDEMKGIPLQDVWNDIRPVRAGKKEAVGYPTQKPLELLERIIQLSTNKSDIILDPYCGCGTSIITAEKLQRKWVGIDVSPTACKIVFRRLKSLNADVKLIGLPRNKLAWLRLPEFEIRNWKRDKISRSMTFRQKITRELSSNKIYPLNKPQSCYKTNI